MQGRDPGSGARTFDLYSVVAPGFDSAGLGMEAAVVGSADPIADRLLSLRSLSFEEVRGDVWPKKVEAIEAMRPVVELVQVI